MTAVFVAITLQAQSPARLEFEVASVKPSEPNAGGSRLLPARGEILAQNVSFRHLIGFAYGLPDTNISGPAWLNSTRIDIFAKGRADTDVAGIRLMTQALLADRLGLEAHRETRSVDVYFLTRGRGEVKMTRADQKQPPNPAWPPGAATMGGDGTISDLAALLGRAIGVPVIDRSEIATRFHYFLWWGPDLETDPDIFHAVSQQLGLSLKNGKGDVDFLVVDHINKTPTEN